MRRQAGRIIVNRLMTPPAGASNWLYLSLVVMGLDQLTKYYVVEQLDLFDRVSLFFWLDITRLHNTGAAFSFLSDAGGWQRWLFIVLGIGVSVAIVFWLRRVPRRGHVWLAIALALIVGGALNALGEVQNMFHLIKHFWGNRPGQWRWFTVKITLQGFQKP